MNLNNYRIETVTLNVQNLIQMRQFYTEILGLSLIEETNETVSLGIAASQTKLLILQQTDISPTRTSGLYHVAYLLPSRQALGEWLNHISRTDYPLQGASDHGYSEAVYLADPEGNGIEIYRDKPETEWDFQPNGVIVGVTEPMDVAGVLGAAKNNVSTFPAGTLVGHVHLSVSSIPPTDDFFRNILNFTLTSKFGQQASFYGKDGYHHQFAGNIWESRNLPKNTDETPGLNKITVAVSHTVLREALTNLQREKMTYSHEEDVLTFHDPNGIRFEYQLS